MRNRYVQAPYLSPGFSDLIQQIRMTNPVELWRLEL